MQQFNVCYLLGHVLRATTGEEIRSRKYSEKLLAPSDESPPETKVFSEELKRQIVEALVQTFRPQLSPQDLQSSSGTQQEFFDLAYALVIQRNLAGYTSLYNSLYALYRGLLAGSRWGGFLSFVYLLFYLLWWLCRGVFQVQLVTFLVLLPIFAYLGYGNPLRTNQESPLKKQFERYARLFAASVYRSFLSWYLTQEGKSKPMLGPQH